MSKKQHEEDVSNFSSIMREIKNDVKADNVKLEYGSTLPNIIEFVEEEKWLGMKYYPQPIRLYPMQRVLLKCFYRGSPGNEDLELTQEEIDLIKAHGLDSEENGNILEKWDSGDIFKELVLVWGRRSGKDFIVSIMALYEAMRLLETPGGNPYTTYNLGSAAPITILTIANSSKQAKILFREIKDKIDLSRYFNGKVGHAADGIIHLLTPNDKEFNEKAKKSGHKARNKGSVQIYAGHSNSDSLVGLSCFAVLFDEIGVYKNTSGSASGEQLYNKLTPATKTYVREEEVLDENGNPVLDEKGKPKKQSVFDGKVICISTPRGKEGIFYDLYSKANAVKHRLMMRAPTWAVNPRLTRPVLLTESPNMSDAQFSMEFGAEFLGTAGQSFFDRDSVEKCFANHTHKMVSHGMPGVTYFAHLDPATSSHNYALCICHKEIYLNRETGQKEFRIVVDHLHHWSPSKDSLISVKDVDEYMIQMAKRFHFGLVTYDHWNSRDSISKLNKSGIPAKETPYSRGYKNKIYDNLYELVITNKIIIPQYQLLQDEMINLQRKFGHNGYKVYPNVEAEVATDDMVDALAGSVYNASSAEESKLPQGKLVNVPVLPSGNNQVWRSMQGTPYGYGSGQQVAQQMQNRTQAYPFR